jgi:hypothetical protein
MRILIIYQGLKIFLPLVSCLKQLLFVALEGRFGLGMLISLRSSGFIFISAVLVLSL